MKRAQSATRGSQLLFATCLVVVAAACGGNAESSDNGEEASRCPPFEPCGGDITGTWHLAEFCLDAPHPLERSCPDATVEAVVSPMGTWSFEPNGTTTIDVITTTTLDFTAPLRCLAANDCAGTTELLLTTNDSATCVDVPPDACKCSTESVQSLQDTTDYTVDGSALFTPDPDNGEMDRAEFCVSGDALQIKGGPGLISLER